MISKAKDVERNHQNVWLYLQKKYIYRKQYTLVEFLFSFNFFRFSIYCYQFILIHPYSLSKSQGMERLLGRNLKYQFIIASLF